MPRIVHVISTPTGVGGAERIVASLVRGAAERGWEPVVLNPFGRNGAGSDLAEICRPAKFESYACASPAGLPRLRRWLGGRIEEVQPDVVHAHLFHAAVAVASLRTSGTPTVLTHHHGDHLVYLGHRWRVALDRWAGRHFDRVVAISEANYRFLRAHYGYEAQLLELIRNGWEGQPQPHTGGVAPTVVCVARFRRQKGHQELLDSFAQVVQHTHAARLVLVGDGELREEITADAAARGLTDRIELRGSCQDVWGELATADVFALASRYEPLGISIIEAMAAGLPVVATNVGGVPELVVDQESGLLFDPDDQDGMARGISRLLEAPEIRERMGAAGRLAASKMTMARTVDGYFGLYDRLIGGRV